MTNDVPASAFAGSSILIAFKRVGYDKQISFTFSGPLQSPDWTPPNPITFANNASPTVIPSLIWFIACSRVTRICKT
ncbi:MAG: hypothetical protein WBF33_13700 [Candidatus Nitrosopolaris sp.]